MRPRDCPVFAHRSVLLAGHVAVVLVSAPLLALQLAYSLLAASCQVHERLRAAAAEIVLSRARGSSVAAPGLPGLPAEGGTSQVWEPLHEHETIFRWDHRVVRYCLDDGAFAPAPPL